MACARLPGPTVSVRAGVRSAKAERSVPRAKPMPPWPLGGFTSTPPGTARIVLSRPRKAKSGAA